MRAAIYIRVSTDEQVREGISLDMQRERCKNAALDAGASDVEVFCDDGYSGTSLMRPALQRFIADMETYDVLYVWRLDRLTRSARDFHNLLHELNQCNVGLVSITERFDASGPVGRLTLGMLASASQFLVDVLRDNVRAAMEEIVRQGRKLSYAPLGYILPGPREVIQIDPPAAEIVREIFAAYAGGKNLLEIAALLNRRNIPSPRGSHWRPNTLRQMLQRVTYIGQVEHSRTGVIIEGLHEAIIDDNTWHKVQRCLAANKSVHPASRRGTLSAVLKCGLCRRGISRLSVSRSKDMAVYACRARYDGLDEHPPITIKEDVLQAHTWLLLDALLSPEADKIFNREVNTANLGGGRNKKIDELRRKRDELRQAIGYNLEAARIGAVDLLVLRDTNAPLQSELELVERRLDEVLSQQPPTPIRYTKKTMKEIKKASIDEQRMFLQAIFDRIEIHVDTLHYVLHDISEPIVIRRIRGHEVRFHGVHLEILS